MKTALQVCPDLPPGQRCPKCGARYICLKQKLPKANQPAPVPAPKEPTDGR